MDALIAGPERDGEQGVGEALVGRERWCTEHDGDPATTAVGSQAAGDSGFDDVGGIAMVGEEPFRQEGRRQSAGSAAQAEDDDLKTLVRAIDPAERRVMPGQAASAMGTTVVGLQGLVRVCPVGVEVGDGNE